MIGTVDVSRVPHALRTPPSPNLILCTFTYWRHLLLQVGLGHLRRYVYVSDSLASYVSLSVLIPIYHYVKVDYLAPTPFAKGLC